MQVAHLTALDAALPGNLELHNADLLKDGDFDEICRCWLSRTRLLQSLSTLISRADAVAPQLSAVADVADIDRLRHPHESSLRANG